MCHIESCKSQAICLFIFIKAYTSIRGSVPELKDNRELAVLMNTVVLHTQMVDSMDDVLNNASDMSILW